MSWGLSQKLPRVVGPNVAKRASLFYEPVSAAEAARHGLVNQVVEGGAAQPALIGPDTV